MVEATGPGKAGRHGLYVRAFDRGLDLLGCFSRERPDLNVPEGAAATGLDRATVRRLFLTFEALGYVEFTGSRYRLTAKVLELGYASLISRDFAALAQPYLDDLAESVDQSCSLGVFDGEAAVFIARAAVRRVMTITLAPGVRVPAFASAMGRALLAGLSDQGLSEYLGHVRLVAYTDRTATDPAEITRRVTEVRRTGWALLDQELEIGVRSIAVPVHDRAGSVVAAISIGTHAQVVDHETLMGPILSALRDCADRIEHDLTAQPVPLPGIGATPAYFAAV
jgi:IclR family pca regulon transcriptional regulator